MTLEPSVLHASMSILLLIFETISQTKLSSCNREALVRCLRDRQPAEFLTDWAAYTSAMEEPRPANNGLKEERGGAFSRSGIGGIDLFGSFPRRRRASSLMAHRVEGLRKIKFDRDHFMFTYTIPPDGHIERLFPTGQLRNGQ
ncbi:unnamed protein product, partial [Cyprideis torosa]